MGPHEGGEGLGQADEPDREGSVAQHLLDAVVGAEPRRVDPHTLPHEEREVAHLLASLDLESFQQLIDDQVDGCVEVRHEPIDVMVCLDAQTRQVDAGEREVATPPGLRPAGVVDVGHDAGAAAHVGDLGLGVAGAVVLGVEGGVLEGEVREETLGAGAAGQLEEVVVGVARMVVDPFHDAEDLDREDRRLAIAQPGAGGLQQAAHHQPGLRARVGAVVDRGERRLGTGARVHRVEVGDEGLHRLVGGPFGLGHRAGAHLVVDSGHLLGGEFGPGLGESFPLGVLGGVVGLQGPGGGKLRHLVLTFLVSTEDASGLSHVGSHPIGAGEGDAGGHVPVEVGDGLTTMLVVLVGLDRDARQGCVGVDRTRGAQVSVPGGETGAEQLAEVDLAAGGRQGEEVEVVDVDVTVPVGGGMGRVEHREQVELLGRLGAEAQHRAHRGVAVDVGVLTLDVAVPGIGEGDLAQ